MLDYVTHFILCDGIHVRDAMDSLVASKFTDLDSSLLFADRDKFSQEFRTPDITSAFNGLLKVFRVIFWSLQVGRSLYIAVVIVLIMTIFMLLIPHQ